MAEEAKWYVVHTYSGYENAVAAAVMKAAENRRMTDLIQEVNIPLETVTEITDSGEKTVERKVFPGYVLVKMILTDDSWHLVHNVRGATGFVGADGKAIPLTQEEILALGVERRDIKVAYDLGDTVRVNDGPLAGFNGPCSAVRLRWIWSSTRSKYLKINKKEVLVHGTESCRIRQIPGSCRKSDSGSPCRTGPRPVRRQHRSVHQGL